MRLRSSLAIMQHALSLDAPPVCFRCDSGDQLKDVMKVEAAHPSGRGEYAETWRLFGLFYHAARLRHRSGAALREWRLIWPAPLARSEACLFRLLTGRMKGNILAARQP